MKQEINNQIIIRRLKRTDLPYITSIYNHAIMTTTSTFDYDKKFDEHFSWHLVQYLKYPMYVATKNGSVVGYGALSRFSERKGYYPMCELSVYVDQQNKHQGIGNLLLQHLTTIGCKLRYHTIVAFTTSENEVMKHLLNKAGYTFSGELKEVAIKFNKRLSLSIFQFYCLNINTEL